MRVTVASINVTNNAGKNLDCILKHIEKADCDIICFPEVCLINDVKNARDISRELSLIRSTARKKRIAVIFGSYCRYRGKIRNQAIAIDKDGSVKIRYNKRRLYVEEKGIAPGTTNKPFNLAGKHVGVVICFDYASVEQIRQLARAGAQVIFCPSYLLSHPKTKEMLERLPQVRAFDAISYFVMVDAQAPRSYGVSRICHPFRELGCIRKEGTMTRDLDLAEIPLLRKKLGTLIDD